MSPAGRPSPDADFRDPPAEYRSLPFWAWNARLDPAELAAQIRSFKAAGMGGFFMHSRDGLETPYLGPEWMAAVRAAVDAAKEEGLEAWLYDEDRWPSGAAGGAVPARGDAFRAKGLTLELLDGAYEPVPGAAAVFRARLDGLSCLSRERLDPALPGAAVRGQTYLVFRVEAAAGDEWFNGEAPPDNLNPDAVDAFLELNYEPYRQAFGADFGGAVPGIFTDEPSVHDRHSRYPAGRGWVPWTYRFAERYAELRGRNVLDSIPLLFFDGPGQEQARHDYWRTVSDLFCSSYTQRIGAWCAKAGLDFTGHYLWENQLGTATRTGGAVMPHYRFQDRPGIDLLCERIDETITVKQCSSVANQYGKKRVLSEMYGCVGWEFSFEGQKWLGDWQYVLGVNSRCQHLALYSLKGCRKRDYPPVFNCNTSWWSRVRVVEDYFARLSAALVQGRPVRDILVLHPASTAWCRLATNPRGFADRGSDRNLPEVNAYGDAFNRFLRGLLGAHYDFDLGDETILAEAGSVDVGEAGAPLLRVGEAAYRLLVIPSIDSLLGSSLRLFQAFLVGGGRAVAVSPGARLLEGAPSPEPAALYGHPNLFLVDSPEQAIKAVEVLLPRRVSLLGARLAEDPDLLCQHRADGARELLFAVNTDRNAEKDIRVELEGVGAVEELCPLDGSSRRVRAEVRGTRTRFVARFGPAGSRLYRFDFSPAAADAALAASDSQAAAFPETPNPLAPPPLLGSLGPTARFVRKQPNALVLDRCSYSLDGGPWSGEMEVWRAQKEARDALGMRQVYYNGLVQRYKWIGEAHPKDGTPLRLRFSFDAELPTSAAVRLALEEAEHFRVALNGAEAAAEPDGWFLDKSFRTLALPPLARGRNELVLSGAYLNRLELEDCFLLGDFAVDARRALVPEPSELRFGDWCLQGYPHYCGALVYRFSLPKPKLGPGRRAVLSLGAYSAVCAALRVNGKDAGLIPWRCADGVDLTPFLGDGMNEVEIELEGSPRNLLGPFHLARGKVAFTDWSAFRPEGAEYTPGYALEPYGLFGPPSIREE